MKLSGVFLCKFVIRQRGLKMDKCRNGWIPHVHVCHRCMRASARRYGTCVFKIDGRRSGDCLIQNITGERAPNMKQGSVGTKISSSHTAT